MRKIIFSIPVSLDGFIEGPQRELDWVIADDELHDFATNLLKDADLLLYGRVTYELMANYWPNAPSDPQATESMKRFANTLNPMRKIVFSRTLQQVDWNTQVRKKFDPDDVRFLKEQAGKNIALSGGAQIAAEFFKYGLVDEFVPIVQPVAIRRGKALFSGLQNLPKLAFQDSQRFGSGAVALRYRINGNL